MQPIDFCYSALALAILDNNKTPDDCIHAICGCPEKPELRTITEEDVWRIQRLRDKGKTWDDIAFMYGVKRSTLWARVKRHRKVVGT